MNRNIFIWLLLPALVACAATTPFHEGEFQNLKNRSLRDDRYTGRNGY